MNSRERIIRTLEFRGPDRPGRDLWALPYISLFRGAELGQVLSRYPSDIGRTETCPGAGDAERDRYAKAGTYTDEWGSVWEVGEPGIIGEVRAPILADWSRLEHFQPPWNVVRNREVGHINQVCRGSDLFMLSSVCARPFERLQFLRGTENTFIDLAYDTPSLRTLLEMVHDYYLEDVRFWAQTDVDGVFLMDDWGSGRSLLIDPRMWRKLFKPLYKQYCDIIRQANKYVFFHSDGNIESIYPDLIEIGVHALNSQLFVMDIEGLAKQYKGKITFWGEIDRQHVLPFGTRDEVQGAVKRVRDSLDDGRGGVIAQCEWGKDNSRDNIEAVFEAWR